MEHQRQQLVQERQQFHLEQLRAAEFRQRQLAAQQLLDEGKLQMPTPPPSTAIPESMPMQTNSAPTVPAPSTTPSVTWSSA